MLGGEDEGFKRAMMSLDTGRIGIGCQAVGSDKPTVTAVNVSSRHLRQESCSLC